MSAVQPSAFADRPADVAGATEVSRFSCMKSLSVRGVFDYAGFSPPLRFTVELMWPSPSTNKVGIPNFGFRSSIARPTNASVYA